MRAQQEAASQPGQIGVLLGTNPDGTVTITGIAPGTDKHGTTGVVNGTLQLIAVVEPPFAPVAVRYAWVDFPECVLFSPSHNQPVPPFNFTVPAV